MMKKKTINPLRQIRWKLAIIYTVTTLCVFFVTDLILTVSTTRQAFLSDGFANSLFQLSLQEGRAMLPFLEQEKVNQVELQRLINQRFPFQNRLPNPATDFTNQPKPEKNNLEPAPKLNASYSSSLSAVVITDENGIIQATNQTENYPINANLMDMVSPAEVEYLEDVADQEMFAEINYSYEDTQTLYLAVPLYKQFDLVGMIYMQIYSPSMFEILSYALDAFIPRIPVMLIVSALVGFLFGFLSARSITNRLDTVTRIAGQWGEGDFSARMDETQQDEVGELTRDLDQMADRFEELLQSKEQLATLEERNRLARDLHDSVKQQLFAVNMTLAAAAALWKKQPDKAFERLEITRKLSQQAQDELSDLIRTLRPLELTEQTLMEAITEYLNDWQRQTHIAAVLEQEGEGKLSSDAEQAVYRIFQEALSNIARHSDASAISLTISYSTADMKLTIHDNGKGFDVKNVNHGIGLNSMRERTESCGGQFTLNSTGNGTKIKVTIPLVPRTKKEQENE